MIAPDRMSQAVDDKLERIVINNLSNEFFCTDDLAREAGLSRNELRRRLKRLNYHNVNRYIRELRLNIALEMLRNDEGTASEIAYRVGFCNPAYFNRCFHEYFGITPGGVKKGLTNGLQVYDGDHLTAEAPDFKHPENTIGEKKLSSADRRNAIIFLLSVTILVMTFLVSILYLVILLGR